MSTLKRLEEELERVKVIDTLKEIIDYIEEEEARLRSQYNKFIKTEEGKEWIESWNGRMSDNEEVGFGEYLYDFYPEML